MHYEAYLTGIEPRSNILIKAIRAYERGEISIGETKSQILSEKRENISFQLRSGLTQIIDPMLDWNDLLRPFTENLGGVSVGGLTRFYENNTFYKKPIVSEKLSSDREVFEEYLDISDIPEGRGRLILPSPYMFADLAQIVEGGYYRRREDLMLDFADILAQQIRSLPQNHFTAVQLTDPSLVTRVLSRDTLRMIQDALEKIGKVCSMKIYLHTHFGDISKIYADILEFKVDSIGVDFIETDIDSLVGYPTEKELGCGVVNARNSRIEAPDEIVDAISTILRKLNPKVLSICPNCDLDFLPRETANMKISSLGRALKQLISEES